jgi:hypothetical protein
MYTNGCSWTWGHELVEETREQSTFSAIIAKSYGLPLINESIVGGSNQRMVRKIIQDVCNLKEKGSNPFVFLNWTEISRFELFSVKQEQWITHFTLKNDDQKTFESLVGNYSSDYADTILFLNQVILIQSFLKSNNIPYLMGTTFEIPWPTLSSKQNLKQINSLNSLIDSTLFLSATSYRSVLDDYGQLVSYGPEHHPLENGHRLLANYLKPHFELRYNINEK